MAGGEPRAGSSPRQRRSWWIAAGLLALLLVVGLVVLWVQAPALYGRGDVAKTAAATTRGAILTVAAALIAATAAGAGVYITARTIQMNQKALDETKRANREELDETKQANREADQREREAQVTDRYTKAIGQLGDPQLAIRLGGIYALERIVADSDRDHRTVVEVLSAFVRNSSQPTTSNRSLDDQSGARSEERPAPAAPPAGNTGQTLTTDVQAALTVLGRLPSRNGVSRGDLTGAHLTGARLAKANLTGAQLARANLTDAELVEATLTDAELAGANLAGAQLAGVDLTRADLGRAFLTDADLGRATLIDINLAGATLTDTNLAGATLTDAELAGANLTGANLAGATLTDTNLAGTNLAMARNLTQQQLDSARGDEDTKLPAGLQQPAHWSAGSATPPAADP